jgi:hypothetical protein
MLSIRKPIHLYPNKATLSATGKLIPHWTRDFACLAALTILAGSARPGQVPGQQEPGPNLDKPYLVPDANRLPNVNDQMRMREKKIAKQNFDAINLLRKKQISEDSNNLVTLAMALKAEVERTKSRELSPSALRKADGIERLAHNVKEMMQLTIGTN